MKAEAYQLKKKSDAHKLMMRRQRGLEVRLANGDEAIRRCICGRLFDKTIFNQIENMKGSEKKYCTKCPMAPKTRTRTFFSKLKNRVVEYECQR